MERCQGTKVSQNCYEKPRVSRQYLLVRHLDLAYVYTSLWLKQPCAGQEARISAHKQEPRHELKFRHSIANHSLYMRMRAPAAANRIGYIPQGRPLFLLLNSQLPSTIEITTMVSITIFVLALPCMLVKSLVILDTPSLTQPGSNATNTNSSNAFYRCNGLKFGYNLDWSSCNEALSQIDASSTTEQTYGPRYQGQFDVKLPKRYISCLFPHPLGCYAQMDCKDLSMTVNGRCYINFGLMPRQVSARASGQEVASAVDYLISNCVRGTPSQGGMAYDVGVYSDWDQDTHR